MSTHITIYSRSVLISIWLNSTEGNLWVSIYGTGSLVVFSPSGRRLREIRMPALYPTCPTWGGQDNDILYITTAKDRTDEPDPNDQGGHVYMHRPTGVQGHTKYEFNG